MITTNFNTPMMVGQTGYTITCDVSGADGLNPIIAYLWTGNDGTPQTPVETNSKFLTLSSIGLSDAGVYTCNAIVNSDLLSNSIMMSNNQIVRIQSELMYTMW